MGKILEGFWDCTSCGTKKIGGSKENCPNCGCPRGEDTKFYIDDGARELSDEEASTVSKNPDWLCSFCNGLNSDKFDHCDSCGASKEDSELNYFQNKQKQEAKEAEMREKEQEWIESTHTGSTSFDDAKPGFFKKYSKAFLGLAIVLLSVFAITGLVKLFTPKVQEVTVDSLKWERNIEVEKLKTFEEDDWSMPSGARLISQTEAIKGYKDVIDHYEDVKKTRVNKEITGYKDVETGVVKDLGNGYFEKETRKEPIYKETTETYTESEPVYKQVPVYATRYYYEIDRWVHERDVSTSGNDLNPKWGEVMLKDKEREGDKTERYIVKVIDTENKTKEMTLDYDKWQKIEKGQRLKVKVVLGNIVGLAE